MDHLSGIDAAFLYLETPETPMHVGSLHVYELPDDYAGDFVEDVRQHIAGRLHLASVFRRVLVNMPFELANPVWAMENDLDLEYHIRSTVLPKPGGRAQLDRLVGRLHSSLLDRSRPLWEFYVIEGLASPPGKRHIGFYAKVHHASLDGAGGIALANAMLDMGPVPREVRAVSRRHVAPSAHYGIAELSAAGVRHSAVQLVKLARTLPTLARTALQRLRAPSSGAGKAASSNWFAPRTPINVSITNQRSFASLSLSLAETRQIAKGNDCTLNDVVMATCAGALRHYLADLGCVPDAPLLAAVPISLREAGNTEMNTQASMMRISLASTIADPLQRLAAIRESSSAAKALAASLKSVVPMDFPSLGAPWLISGLAALYGRSRLANRIPPLANVAISNVPGPKFALYLAGAKMLTYYPVSIVSHGLALNVTVQSYNGSLDYGLTACRKAMPDLPDMARLMQAAHEELLRLTPVAEAEARPEPKAVSKAAAKAPRPLKLVQQKPLPATPRAPRAAKARRVAV